MFDYLLKVRFDTLLHPDRSASLCGLAEGSRVGSVKGDGCQIRISNASTCFKFNPPVDRYRVHYGGAAGEPSHNFRQENE